MHVGCASSRRALGACGANSPEPVPEDEPSLVGLWRDTCPRGNVKVIDLRADGSYIFYADPLGEPRSEMSRGEYTLDDDTLTLEVDSVCVEVAGTYSWVCEGKR